MTNKNAVTILLTFCIFTALSSHSQTISECVTLLNNGKYKQAARQLQTLQSTTTAPVERARIFRHLGTCRQKLNNNYTLWTSCFDNALSLLSSLPDIPQEELAVTHFQKANCLINSAFIKLRNANLSGISERDRFKLIQHYLSPAEKSLTKAKAHYPEPLSTDLLILESDIQIFVQLISKEKINPYLLRTLNHNYTKTLDSNQNSRNDIKLYALVRKITILRSDGQIQQALKLAQKALNLNTENLELNLEAKLQYAATKLLTAQSQQDYNELEPFLKKCITEVEILRTQNLNSEQFVKTKQFFSQRTSAYELLLDLYNRFDKCEEMLITIDQMKARTFKEFVINFSPIYPILNLKKVQKNLKTQKAVVIEYFLGFSKSWLFIITPEHISKHQLNTPGHSIVQKVNRVISGYQNTSLLRHYRPSTTEPLKYQELLKTYQAGHDLYNILLKPLALQKENRNTLYIVPHDILNYLPFSALIKKLDSSNLLNSLFYIETAPPISYIPSLSLLARQSCPRYKGPSTVFYRDDFSEAQQLCNLPNADQQARVIADLVNGKLLSGGNFSIQQLTREKYNNLLYIASHVKHHDDAADNAIILGNKNKESLSVEELINHYTGKIKANLGVLCLCATNVGEAVPLPGDDLATLSRALLIAGLRSVITSQWNVTDKQTPMILKDVTINYNSGSSAAESLDLAIKKYLKEVPSQFYRHPFYWGNLLVLEKEPTR